MERSLGLDELLALQKHAAGAAAWIEYPAFVGCQHLNQNPNHAARGVELPALLALG